MTIAKDFASKAVVAFVAAAMIFTMFTPSAQAQSTEDLQAMINNLLAQIAALQTQVGGSTGAGSTSSASFCPYTWTRDLSSGATGMDVMRLQQFLNSDADTRVSASGVGSMGMETEFYGPATAAAVSKLQVKYRAEVLSPNGLVNPTGYFGASTRNKANSLCSATIMTPAPVVPGTPVTPMPGTPTTPVMGGTEAELTNFNFRAGDRTDVEEGASDVAVAEIEFDVEDGDVRVDRLDVWFDRSAVTGTAEVEPWRVFEEVSVWVDGEKVASQRVSSRNDWSRNVATDNDRVRFTGLDIMFQEDDRAVIVIGVSTQSTVRDPNGANWIVKVPNDGVRGRDGAGIDQFIGATAQTVQFSIEQEGRDDEIRIRKASSDPAATVLELEDDRTSNYMTVFAFDYDTRDSTSDIQVNELWLAGTYSSSTVNLSTIANDVRLRVGGRTYSRSTFGTISGPTWNGAGNDVRFTFNDDEFVINRGDSVVVEVMVRFNALPTALEGTTLVMSHDTVVAEGTRTLTSGDISGGATSETHTLLTEGLRFVKKSMTSQLIQATVAGQNDRAEYTLVVDVTAIGDQFFVEDSSAQFGFEVFQNGTASTTVVATPTLSSNATKELNRFRIDEGQTRTFTLKVNVQPGGTAAAYRVQFEDVDFFAAPSGGSALTQPLQPVAEYRSDEIVIVN